MRAQGRCREVVLGGRESYWLVQVVEWRANYYGNPLWFGSMKKETCDAMRTYMANLRQPVSDCTRVQVLFK
jgi:hypothetical protein